MVNFSAYDSLLLPLGISDIACATLLYDLVEDLFHRACPDYRVPILCYVLPLKPLRVNSINFAFTRSGRLPDHVRRNGHSPIPGPMALPLKFRPPSQNWRPSSFASRRPRNGKCRVGEGSRTTEPGIISLLMACGGPSINSE